MERSRSCLGCCRGYESVGGVTSCAHDSNCRDREVKNRIDGRHTSSKWSGLASAALPSDQLDVDARRSRAPPRAYANVCTVRHCVLITSLFMFFFHCSVCGGAWRHSGFSLSPDQLISVAITDVWSRQLFCWQLHLGAASCVWFCLRKHLPQNIGPTPNKSSRDSIDNKTNELRWSPALKSETNASKQT